MIFSPKLYSKPVAELILSGTKCQTRRLLKEGEVIYISPRVVCNKNDKVKWQVGRDYCVSLGRGKAGLWYCSKCKVQQTEKEMEECWGSALYKKVIANQNKIISEGYECPYCEAGTNGTFKPLRIKITGLRKEYLRDITEEDAEKEGLEPFFVLNPKDGQRYCGPNSGSNQSSSAKLRFVRLFYKLYKRKDLPRSCGICSKIWYPDDWNPEVWVISFCVKGAD